MFKMFCYGLCQICPNFRRTVFYLCIRYLMYCMYYNFYWPPKATLQKVFHLSLPWSVPGNLLQEADRTWGTNPRGKKMLPNNGKHDIARQGIVFPRFCPPVYTPLWQEENETKNVTVNKKVTFHSNCQAAHGSNSPFAALFPAGMASVLSLQHWKLPICGTSSQTTWQEIHSY